MRPIVQTEVSFLDPQLWFFREVSLSIVLYGPHLDGSPFWSHMKWIFQIYRVCLPWGLQSAGLSLEVQGFILIHLLF